MPDPIWLKLQIFRNGIFLSQIQIQQPRKPSENQFLNISNQRNNVYVHTWQR